jgi:hypothetical protein
VIEQELTTHERLSDWNKCGVTETFRLVEILFVEELH